MRVENNLELENVFFKNCQLRSCHSSIHSFNVKYIARKLCKHLMPENFYDHTFVCIHFAQNLFPLEALFIVRLYRV